MRSNRKTILCALGLGLATILGCDGYAEVRAGLGEAERARFDRGMKAAVPCWSCHDVTGQGVKVGPPLAGLIGRRAGAASGYPYSAALRGSGIVWTPPALDAFLADPAGMVPGNRMLAPGISDASARRDLIFFLRHATSATPAY